MAEDNISKEVARAAITIERNGFVYINGRKLNEPYVKSAYRDQSADRTLTDEDAARLRNAIVDVFHEDFGAELRAG